MFVVYKSNDRIFVTTAKKEGKFLKTYNELDLAEYERIDIEDTFVIIDIRLFLPMARQRHR